MAGTNEHVIVSWLRGIPENNTRLRTDGETLWSGDFQLAWRHPHQDHMVLINRDVTHRQVLERGKRVDVANTRAVRNRRYLVMTVTTMMGIGWLPYSEAEIQQLRGV